MQLSRIHSRSVSTQRGHLRFKMPAYSSNHPNFHLTYAEINSRSQMNKKRQEGVREKQPEASTRVGCGFIFDMRR